MTVWAAVLAVVAALGFGVGSVLQAAAAAGATPWRVLLRRPSYLGGQAADGVGYGCSLIAVRILPVFVVEGILATSLAVTAVLGRTFLGARIRRLDVAAIAVVVCGAVTLAASGVRTDRPHSGRAVDAAVVVLVLAMLLALGPVLRAARAWTLALLAGAPFAGEVLAERTLRLGPDLWASLALLVRQPVSWALAVLAVLGAALYARALAGGGVGPVTAIPWAVEIVVPSVVGIAVLGDAVRAGWAAAAALALLATLAATAVLATAPGPNHRLGDSAADVGGPPGRLPAR